MQFWFTVARVYDLEVHSAVSSAWNAFGVLLTWQTSILSLVSCTISSPGSFLCSCLPLTSFLTKQTRLVPLLNTFREPYAPLQYLSSLVFFIDLNSMMVLTTYRNSHSISRASSDVNLAYHRYLMNILSKWQHHRQGRPKYLRSREDVRSYCVFFNYIIKHNIKNICEIFWLFVVGLNIGYLWMGTWEKI